MSNRCIHKDTNGEQCPVMVETGLFCETHAAEAGKAAPRPGGGGGGGGFGGGGGRGFRESIFRKLGVVYHHEPPEKKKDYFK